MEWPNMELLTASIFTWTQFSLYVRILMKVKYPSILFLIVENNFIITRVHPNTTNAERSSKRGYIQLYRRNAQGKKT